MSHPTPYRLLRIGVCLFAALAFGALLTLTAAANDHLIARLQAGSIPRAADSHAFLRPIDARAPGLAGRLMSAGVTRLRLEFPNFSPGAIQSHNRRGEPVTLVDLSGYYVLELSPGTGPAAALATLRGDPHIQYLAPEGVGRIGSVPNDSLYSEQWWLNNTATNTGCPSSLLVSDCDINAPDAWSISTDCSSAKVAIIDTGIDIHHPDLPHNVIGLGADYITAEGNGDDGDSGHGTQVTGIIAAKGNNHTGVTGVCWTAPHIVNIKAFNDAGSGTSFDVAAGIDTAVTLGAGIVNMSFTVSGDDVRDACRNAFLQGVLLVGISGNENAGSVDFPAAYSRDVLGVGAVFNNKRWQDSTIAYSACHPNHTSGSNWGASVDLVAPGGNGVATTLAPSTYVGCGPCGDGFSGTSAAAPVVSGVAALLQSNHPALTGEDLAQVMERSATNLYPGLPYPNDSTGFGLVRADAALTYLASPRALFQQFATGLTQTDTSMHNVAFTGIDSLTDGTYLTRRYRLRKVITFGMHYDEVPDQWIRQSGTNGASDSSAHGTAASEPNFGRVVAGTLTSAGCTVETFVYDILNGSGQHLKWWPVTTSGASVALSAVGPTDTTPPGTPELSLAQFCTHLDLSWNDTGDDGSVGGAALFELRESSSTITLANWSAADVVASASPGGPGTPESVVSYVGSCSGTVHYGLRIRDNADNWSGLTTATGATPCVDNCEDALVAGSGESNGEPSRLELSRAVPVVVRGSIKLSFVAPSRLERDGLVVQFLDVTGRIVRKLELGSVGRGGLNATWDLRGQDGSRVRAGVYFMRARLGGDQVTRRLVVL